MNFIGKGYTLAGDFYDFSMPQVKYSEARLTIAELKLCCGSARAVQILRDRSPAGVRRRAGSSARSICSLESMIGKLAKGKKFPYWIFTRLRAALGLRSLSLTRFLSFSWLFASNWNLKSEFHVITVIEIPRMLDFMIFKKSYYSKVFSLPKGR